MSDEKTLGRIGYEAEVACYADSLGIDPKDRNDWDDLSDKEKAAYEAGGLAVVLEYVKRCGDPRAWLYTISAGQGSCLDQVLSFSKGDVEGYLDPIPLFLVPPIQEQLEELKASCQEKNSKIEWMQRELEELKQENALKGS